MRPLFVALAAGLCPVASAHADPVNLAPFAEARASDMMDGRRGPAYAVDGDPDTSWNVWGYHVPKDRKDVSIELTFWRPFPVTAIVVTWNVRPPEPAFAVRRGGDWQPAGTPEAREDKTSRLRWATPQDLTGFRLSTPRDHPDISVREIEIWGDPGPQAQVLSGRLPEPSPSPADAGELSVTFSKKGGKLDGGLDGAPRVSRIEVDWSRAPRRSVLELTEAGGRVVLAACPRFRTVYDLPAPMALSRVRIIPLEAEAQPLQMRVLGPGGKAAGAVPRLAVWPEVALLKVGREDAGPNAKSPVTAGGILPIALARNEYEAGQVVLRNPAGDRSARGVALRIGELRDDAGHALPATMIAWNPLGYVNRVHTDVLMPQAPFDVPPHSCRPVWITVHATSEQPPGRYRGAVEILQPGFEPQKVALDITVWPVTLPVKTSVESTYFGIYGIEGQLKAVLDDPPARARLATSIMEDYARHRLFCGMHPFEKEGAAMTAAAEKGDFRELEAMAAFWKARGIPFEIGVPWNGGAGGPERFAAWARELEKRSWDGAVGVSDEPRGKVPAVVAACEKLAQWAPYLRAKSAFKACPAGYEFSYIGLMREWGYQPRIWNDHAIDAMVAFNREREAKGEKVFWYIHTFLPLAREAYLHRMYFWALWRHQVRGPMLYSTCEWDFSGVDHCLDEFVISEHVDGQGTLLWPGEGCFLDGVRWETIRDGIEDFDLHALLKERAEAYAKAHPDGPLAAEARKALFDTDGVFRAVQDEKDAAGWELRMNSGGSPTWVSHNRPDDLYEARARVARLIAEMEK